mgnify:CR=1 FL=1
MKHIIYSIVVLLCLSSCSKKQDPFLIGKDQIGKLYKDELTYPMVIKKITIVK